MYEEMLVYVENYLQNNKKDQHDKFHFRKRSEHTRRVFMWSKRISENINHINKEALFISAIFHDVGYATSPNDHAKESAIICENYLRQNNFDLDLIYLVVYLIKNHSNKKLLKDATTPLELILLMESDLLDETGALAIIWDAMAEGMKQSTSFADTYQHLIDFSYKQLLNNLMITEKAKFYWEQKQQLTNEFIKQLSIDLMVEKRNLI